MFRQTGQLPFTEPDTACLHFPSPFWSRNPGRDSPPVVQGVPSFLSPAPPRSEGEALLRRIFSRGEVV
ncbi:hypothetical protein JRI60_03220 [Archangium violaceum]|uniref:hypothetical protein n=1 Tax=Archangium violaceum TaxID=83451 RepID=UPI0019512F8C|nr:hypothetical protein [Archangium violaceum]QRN98100.1 hypothetical protein JRI60_03220 [Archangium violaceum]